MKKYKNFMIYTLIFIIVMLLAVIGYNYLSQNYEQEETQTEEIINQDMDNGKINSIQNEATTLKKATDFNVINNNRRKSKFI